MVQVTTGPIGSGFQTRSYNLLLLLLFFFGMFFEAMKESLKYIVFNDMNYALN